MGAYSLETLVKKWGRGELTVEQAVGQILLNLQELRDSVVMLERRVYPSTGSGRRRRPLQDRAEDEGTQL